MYGVDGDMGGSIETVDNGVAEMKDGVGDGGGREVEIEEGEGDESDGDEDGTWMRFAIGMGFSAAETMWENDEMEDTEEEGEI